MFHDRLEIVTPRVLPAGMWEDLGIRSVPRNRLLRGMCHRMGMVEHIGSGLKRICQGCRYAGLAEPLIEVSDIWVTTTFRRPSAKAERETEAWVHRERHSMADTNPHQVMVLRNYLPDSAISECCHTPADATAPNSRDQVMDALLKPGRLEMTIPDKPTSSQQKYRLTVAGRQTLEELNGRDSSALEQTGPRDDPEQ